MLNKPLPYMPMIVTKNFSKLILFVFLIFSSLTFAQTPPPPDFGDDVNDELPIDSHLVVLFGFGVALGYFLLKKNEIGSITQR